MSALLALCNGVIEPVDHADEFTDKKVKSKIKRKYRRKKGLKPRVLRPFYSPLWDEAEITGRGRRIISIIFEDGLRFKKCSRCHDWLPSDTEFFHINQTAKVGLSSACRVCKNKSQLK